MNLSNLPNFEDVCNDKRFTEEFIKIDSILNKPIAILDYGTFTFKEKNGVIVDKVQILIDINGERRVISTASEVLMRQVKTAKVLPFAAKIVKIKQYYTFSNIGDENERIA